MSSDKLILYDIPSKDSKRVAWSFNPWRIRLTLNYKKIPYETQWVEYPDIAPLLSSLGVPPGEDPDTPYTIPTVRFPDGTLVMNSRLIIPEIEKRYPAPEYVALQHDIPTQRIAVDLMRPLHEALHPALFARVPRDLLNAVSAEFFWRTRKEYFGMSLDDLEKEKGGEGAWRKSQEGWDQVVVALKKHDGPYLLGNEVTFADFILVGYLQFIDRLAHDEYETFGLKGRPEIAAFHKACGPWLERDSF